MTKKKPKSLLQLTEEKYWSHFTWNKNVNTKKTLKVKLCYRNRIKKSLITSPVVSVCTSTYLFFIHSLLLLTWMKFCIYLAVNWIHYQFKWSDLIKVENYNFKFIDGCQSKKIKNFKKSSKVSRNSSNLSLILKSKIFLTTHEKWNFTINCKSSASLASLI